MKPKTISAVALFLTACAVNAQVTINVDATQKGPKISPTHYGIFFEDINHAADGGLYAELIRNRSFEDDMRGQARMRRNNQQVNTPRITAWSTKDGVEISLTQSNLLNSVQHNALNVKVAKQGGWLSNEGFWGINAVKGRKYKLSFWAKSDAGYKGNITFQLMHSNTVPICATSMKVKFGKEWKKYTAEFTAEENDPKSQFVMILPKEGEFQLDVVSLFPPTFKDRENGMRPDLAQMLADMHPKFMRFPGGCFVEGQETPDNAFRWKRTIGPIEQREGHENVNWGYRTSDGIGFHEYLQLAEDIGAKPLFVVNVGIWHGGCTPYNEIGDWIQECLDALEYANGDVTTKYGKMRADNGHPEPFGLEYIEIGNENYNFNMNNNSDQSDHYPERYIQFYNAIKAKYPNVHCIGNVESWGTDNPSWRNEYPVEMVDEHYYRNPSWFANNFKKYDSYDRSKYKVYVGEYAVTSQFGNLGNLNAALGEAVYMMGMENNSDVTIMNSYAPIFVNENDARWRPDMIRFNSEKVMGTPSYYVQQLFPNNIGTQVLKTDWTYKLTLPEAEMKAQAQPVRVGFATWETTVHYRNPQLIVDGKNIAINDFSKWEKQNGDWDVIDGNMVQTSKDAPAIIICPENISAKNYTYKVQAKKTEGTEGFLLLFGYKNSGNYCCYNIGGWQNTQNNVEQAIEGGKVQLGRAKNFKVELNKWYNLQVDVKEDSMFCYIDGKLDFACKLQKGGAMEGVYASTTIDEASKMMYVKVVNVGEGYADGTLNLKNCQVDTSNETSLRLIRLFSEKGTDENSLDEPRKIYPGEGRIKAESPTEVLFEVPGYSVNILKIKLK